MYYGGGGSGIRWRSAIQRRHASPGFKRRSGENAETSRLAHRTERHGDAGDGCCGCDTVTRPPAQPLGRRASWCISADPRNIVSYITLNLEQNKRGRLVGCHCDCGLKSCLLTVAVAVAVVVTWLLFGLQLEKFAIFSATSRPNLESRDAVKPAEEGQIP